MAKTKNKNNLLKTYSKIGVFVIIALAVLSIIMAALVAVTYTKNDVTTSFTGFEVVFGKKIEDASFSIGSFANATNKVDFSFLALCAYFLPVVGAVASLLLALLAKKKNMVMLGGILAFVCFIVAAILVFMVPSITSFTSTGNIGSLSNTTTKTFAELEYSLGLGAILAGVINIVGALASLTFVASKR